MHPPLTICLHRGTSAIGRVIRWFTRGEYSHVSLILPDGRHVEAREGRGVVMHEKFTPAPGEAVDFFELTDPLDQFELAKGRAFIAETLGQGYDYRMVVAFVTRGRAKTASNDDWFCSEWAYQFFMDAGRKLLRTGEAWTVSPRDFGLSPLLTPLRINHVPHL